RVTGRGADLVGVGSTHAVTCRGLPELGLVQAVRAADEGNHRLAVDDEHEGLDDLGNVTADGGRGVGRRPRALRERAYLDVEPERRRRGLDLLLALHVRTLTPRRTALRQPRSRRD